MVLGPFDKRALGKRCLECRQRHLKCEGLNCKACHVAQRKCVLSAGPKQIIKLDKAVNHAVVRHKSAVSGKRRELWQPMMVSFTSIPKRVDSNTNDLLVDHFHNSFLRMNSFTGRPASASNAIHSYLVSSQALSNVAMAISSIVTQREQCPNASPKAQSIQYYRQAVTSLQTDLQDQRLNRNYSVLWSTFFLGLFELMSDATGDGWIMHFLHGTSELLGHFGPSAFMTEPGREFFLTIRVFEISRALLFTQETFLSQPRWKILMEGLCNDKSSYDWHPKEELFNIIISCASLGVRSTELMTQLPQLSLEDQFTELESIAVEGLALRISLEQWKSSVHLWPVANDEQMSLALIYYYAISILLSGVFDYFSHWDERGIHTPTITSLEVQENVQQIITMTTTAVRYSNLAGILFLFPLRVAGARVETQQEPNILWLLSEISKRGFVVANTIAEELGQYWSIMGSYSINI